MVTAASIAISSSSAGATAPESLLVRCVKAHVRKGEQAKERAAQNHKKSEGHFIAAGRYLAMLKTSYAPSWKHWEVLLQVKVGLSTGRASELMQLADGRKNLQEIRDATAQRVKALRADQNVFATGQCNEDEEIPDEIFEGPASDLAKALPLRARELALGAPATNGKDEADRLIDALAASNAKTRGCAAEALISGSRQSQFASVTAAIADLYARLSRAGR